VTLRPATEADIPAMHLVRLEVRENVLDHPAKVGFDDYRQKLRDGRGWVFEIDGAVVGFAVADLKMASVWALFVSPAFQGRGVGRALHDAILGFFRESSAGRIWLSTEPNTRAERFYERAGWERTGLTAGGEIRFERGG
jgi:GNAT superfamily N-acetyltransferase